MEDESWGGEKHNSDTGKSYFFILDAKAVINLETEIENTLDNEKEIEFTLVLPNNLIKLGNETENPIEANIEKNVLLSTSTNEKLEREDSLQKIINNNNQEEENENENQVVEKEEDNIKSKIEKTKTFSISLEFKKEFEECFKKCNIFFSNHLITLTTSNTENQEIKDNTELPSLESHNYLIIKGTAAQISLSLQKYLQMISKIEKN